MEDALALAPTTLKNNNYECLNPCFNGRCTRTPWILGLVLFVIVLILVLMEDALAPT